MTSQHEVHADRRVQARQDSPRQVPQHVRVLVLTRTVVSMQVHHLLAHAEVGEIVVQVADHTVRPLTGRNALINQVVHL